MSDPVTASITFDEPTMLTGFRWHNRVHRTRHWLRLALLLVASSLVVAGLVMSDEKGYAEIPLIYPIVFAVLVAFAANALRRWLERRRFTAGIRSSPLFNEAITYQADPEQIEITAPQFKGTLTWKAFHKSVETPEGLLLYQQRYLFNWLPKAAFSPADYSSLFAWAAAKTQHSKIG